MVEQYTYLAPTKPLRDWLRLSTVQPFAGMVGGPGATTARIFASLLPGGCTLPAVAFHRLGGGVDNTLDLVQFQFDCYGATPEGAEDLAAALATLLVSTPPRTRLTAALVFEGPGVIVDQLYLPVQTTRVPRVVLRAQLVLAAY
jgi:hypothetical protein